MEQRLHTKLNAGVCATVLQRHGEHVNMESSEKKFRWCFQEHLHMNGMWLQADRKVAQQRTSRHERCPWLWAQVSHTDCFQIRGKYTRHVKTRSELGLQAVNWRLLKVYRAIQSTNLIIFLKNYYYKKTKQKKKRRQYGPRMPRQKNRFNLKNWRHSSTAVCVCVCLCTGQPQQRMGRAVIGAFVTT